MPSTQQPNCQRSKPKPSRQADWAKVPATGQEASPRNYSDLLHTQVKNLAQVEGVEFRARRRGCQLGGNNSWPRIENSPFLTPTRHLATNFVSAPHHQFLTNFVPIYGTRTSPQGAPKIDLQSTPKPLLSNDLRIADTGQTAVLAAMRLTVCCQSVDRVETKGIEPSTPALQRQCSPN